MSNHVGLNIEHQSQDQWCWSAVSVSIDKFRGGALWDQCTLVNHEFHQTTCCIDGSSDDCDKPWYLDQALQTVGRLNGLPVQGAAPFAEIRAEIDAGNPLALRIGWFAGGGHFVTVVGYDDTDPANIILEIRDPWFGEATVPQQDFPQTYESGGNWTHTYFIL